MIGLLDVTRVKVPLALALQAHAHLRRVGEHGAEGFALWAGAREGTTFWVRETVIPTQREIRDRRGRVGVLVDGSELHRLNLWLYERDMMLIAQLHSHPGEAYHSPTDDSFPIATTIGSLSLVIPNFARASFTLDDCAVYRLSVQGHWVELDAAEARQLIRVGD